MNSQVYPEWVADSIVILLANHAFLYVHSSEFARESCIGRLNDLTVTLLEAKDSKHAYQVNRVVENMSRHFKFTYGREPFNVEAL